MENIIKQINRQKYDNCFEYCLTYDYFIKIIKEENYTTTTFGR